MSLTEHLLLNLDIQFPQGQRKIHRMEREEKDMSACHSKGLARNAETFAQNVEKTFIAIMEGCETPQQIVKASSIGISTIRKTLDALIITSRVYRVRVANTYHYFVSKQ
jgi:hypothetical protein